MPSAVVEQGGVGPVLTKLHGLQAARGQLRPGLIHPATHQRLAALPQPRDLQRLLGAPLQHLIPDRIERLPTTLVPQAVHALLMWEDWRHVALGIGHPCKSSGWDILENLVRHQLVIGIPQLELASSITDLDVGQLLEPPLLNQTIKKLASLGRLQGGTKFCASFLCGLREHFPHGRGASPLALHCRGDHVYLYVFLARGPLAIQLTDVWPPHIERALAKHIDLPLGVPRRIQYSLHQFSPCNTQLLSYPIKRIGQRLIKPSNGHVRLLSPWYASHCLFGSSKPVVKEALGICRAGSKIPDPSNWRLLTGQDDKLFTHSIKRLVVTQHH